MGAVPARLYYDPACGPCRFFARAMAGMGRGHLTSLPFDSGPADVELSDLAEEARFGSAHVVAGTVRRSGAGIVVPLVGVTFGRTAEDALERWPALGRPLEWLYGRLWEHRRRHGCARPGP